MRVPVSFASLGLLAAFVVPSSPVAAQWLSVSITPQYASYAVGTPVDVTIDVCAFEGSMTWHYETIYFNGVDLTSEFEIVDWASTQCQISWGVDGYTLTGSYTTINGPNTLRFVYTSSIENGDITVPNYATYAALVTPDDSTAASQTAYTSGHTKVFVVKNWGSSSDTYKLRCVGSGSIVCDSTTNPTVSLGAGASANVTAYYGVNAAGSGKLYLGAYGSGVSDSGSMNITASAQTAGAPVIDPTVYNYDNQSVAACAQTCFAATHAQSAVPYFSLSTPRTVTLMYNGDRLNPKQFIHVDVKRDESHGSRPLRWELRAKVRGLWRLFANGDSVLHFDTLHADGKYQRIGGLLDTLGFATGVYPMDVAVRAVYAGSTSDAVYTTKLVVVNETNSLVAKGWTLGGFQRWYPQTDGSALITEGDGSAVYFQRTMTGSGSSQYSTPFANPAGGFSKLGYLQGGDLAWTRLFVDSTKVAFDTLGRMTSIQDRFANTVTIVYKNTTTDTVWKVKDPLDTATVLSYGTYGLSSIAAKGRTTTITVNSSRQLTVIKDPDNDSTRFSYDGSSRLSTVTNRLGHASTITYDAWGKVDSVTAPSVTVIKAAGGDTTVAPAVNLTAWHGYGVPTSPTNSTTNKDVSRQRADSVKASVREPGGGLTRFTVNRWGAPKQITAPLGYVTTVDYDANGLPIRTTGPTGAVDTVAYNSSGLPVYMRSKPDSGVYVHYAGWGQPDTIRGYQRPKTVNVIGANGRISSSTVGGSTTSYTYDSRGRIDSISDQLSHLIRRTWYWGPNGNPSKDSVPGGRVDSIYYDAYGRDSAMKAPGFATRRIIYDVMNRPKLFYDGVNATADSTFYDALLPTRVSIKGQSHSAVYNALGWPIRQTDPVGKIDTLGYSIDGDLRRWVNRRGQVTTFTYDSLHRSLKTSGDHTPTDSVVYLVKPDTGYVVIASDSVTTETTYFGLEGRPDSILTLIAGQTYKRRYRYSLVGRLDSTVVSVVSGVATFTPRRYKYDTTTFALDSILLGSTRTGLIQNLDQLDTAQTFPGASVQYQYTPSHRLAAIISSAEFDRRAAYDKADRLKRIVLTDDEAVNNVAANGFAYDSLGRLIADTLLYRASGGYCTIPATVLDDGDPCATNGSWSVTSVTPFKYDAFGNDTTLGGQYGAGNRIRQFDSCTYATDSLADGNVVRRICGADTIRFHWTAQSRLRAIKVVGGDSVVFSYDGGGRLVRRTVNGTSLYYIWDGDNLLAELNANGTRVAEYSYYPGLDNLHALIVGTTPYFAYSDMMGNVTTLVDSTGYPGRTYGYTRRGGTSGGNDYFTLSNVDRARFKGALWMGPQMDIYYMRARWYEPKTGRFLSEDPIGLAGGPNLYTFASGDPVNGSDPTGQWPDPVPLAPVPVDGAPYPPGGSRPRFGSSCEGFMTLLSIECERQRFACTTRWDASSGSCEEAPYDPANPGAEGGGNVGKTEDLGTRGESCLATNLAIGSGIVIAGAVLAADKIAAGVRTGRAAGAQLVRSLESASWWHGLRSGVLATPFAAGLGRALTAELAADFAVATAAAYTVQLGKQTVRAGVRLAGWAALLGGAYVAGTWALCETGVL